MSAINRAPMIYEMPAISRRPSLRWIVVLASFLVTMMFATRARAGITVTIASPTSAALVGTTLTVVADVSSTFDLASVHAQVDTVGGDLTLIGSDWQGTLAIGGLSRGTKTLTVTATDLAGGTSSASVTFTHDNPPVITVAAPLDYTVARPDARLSATCSDDDPVGCTGFAAIDDLTSAVLASGTGGVIDTTVTLSAYEGKLLTLNFQANDSTGKHYTRRVLLSIPVDSSPRLSEVVTLGGRILDATADRVLFLKADGSVVIRDRASAAEMTLGTAYASLGGTLPWGRLTSVGATWASYAPGSSGACTAYEWRPTTGATTYAGCTVLVAGDYAYFNPPTLRNLTTGAEVSVAWPVYSSGSTTGGVLAAGVASNGDVVGIGEDIETSPWTSPIVRYRASTIATIASFPWSYGFGCGARAPTMTDGVNVLYEASISTGCQLAFVDATGTRTFLSDPTPSYVDPDWELVAGWVAFSKKSASGYKQVWTRSPSGTLKQVSIFGADSKVETLSAIGDLMFLSGRRRYLGAGSGGPTDVSSDLGTSKDIGGGWYVMMGRTLFHVDGTPTAADAGPIGDAGSDGGDAAATDSVGADATATDTAVDATTTDTAVDATTTDTAVDASADDVDAGLVADTLAVDTAPDVASVDVGDTGSPPDDTRIPGGDAASASDAGDDAAVGDEGDGGSGGCTIGTTEGRSTTFDDGWPLLAVAMAALRRRRIRSRNGQRRRSGIDGVASVRVGPLGAERRVRNV
jgi:hypothetical protein